MDASGGMAPSVARGPASALRLGEGAPRHSENSAHLSSFLRDFRLLMNDHLGHGHVWVLLLGLLDGLHKDLRRTERTESGRKQPGW